MVGFLVCFYFSIVFAQPKGVVRATPTPIPVVAPSGVDLPPLPRNSSEENLFNVRVLPYSYISPLLREEGDDVFFQFTKDKVYKFPNPPYETGPEVQSRGVLLKYIADFEAQFLREFGISNELSPFESVNFRMEKYFLEGADSQELRKNKVAKVKFYLIRHIINSGLNSRLNLYGLVTKQQKELNKMTAENAELTSIISQQASIFSKFYMPILIPLVFSLLLNFICLYFIVSK